MTRQEIVNKMRFRDNCRLYRLDCNNFEIYDDTILINTPKEDIFVLFDKNYNTIGVEKKPKNISKEQFVKDKCFVYKNYTDSLPYGLNIGYPFEKYTLKNIIDLSSRIEIIETNQGHTTMTKVNDNWYRGGTGNSFLLLLSYIKFLGQKLEQYYIYKYQMLMLGFNVPDEYSYLSSLISNVTESVEKSITNNLRPFPDDILSYIGEQGKGEDFDRLLYDVVDLLMQEKNLKVKESNYQELEQTNTKKDLTMMATELLKLLDLTDEGLIEKQLSNLRSYINEDGGIEHCKEEKAPTLVKNKKHNF